jgi:hypothetical protein
MARRYEAASTVLTSNKPFDEWGEIFGNDLMAGALIDRLLHRRHIVNIRGNRYRMRHHQDLGTRQAAVNHRSSLGPTVSIYHLTSPRSRQGSGASGSTQRLETPRDVSLNASRSI